MNRQRIWKAERVDVKPAPAPARGKEIKSLNNIKMRC